jgi:hypothetical protein
MWLTIASFPPTAADPQRMKNFRMLPASARPFFARRATPGHLLAIFFAPLRGFSQPSPKASKESSAPSDPRWT